MSQSECSRDGFGAATKSDEDWLRQQIGADDDDNDTGYQQERTPDDESLSSGPNRARENRRKTVATVGNSLALDADTA